MKLCSIEKCENKYWARGWCRNHYERWRRNGDPNITQYHGYSRSPLYKLWIYIKSRCCNPKDTRYEDYGGRGITICNQWKNDPVTFIEWALPLWEKGLYIDRINNDGNYCPENCRFITPGKSILNQRLLYKSNKSGYRGASFSKSTNNWVSNIRVNNKQFYLGSFNSPRLAGIRYDVEAYLLNDDRPENFF